MTDSRHISASRNDAASVADALATMFVSFRERAEDAEAMLTAYASILDDLPAWAIIKACEAFAKGKVANRRNSFTPTAAEIHERADFLVEEDERHKRLLRPPMRQLPPPPGPSMVQRLAAIKPLDDYRAELKGATIDHDAEKRREMWKEMGPRIWARFGHDPAKPWKPSAELEELIRSKPITKAEQDAA